MSGNRSRQAWQLAHALAELAGVPVTLAYHGARRDEYGGWHIEWAGGPIAVGMRAHVAALGDRYPAICAAHLEYVRGYTDQHEAVALLLWLDAHRHEIRHLSTFTVREAYAECGYPEGADEVWQARGRALLSLSEAGTVGGAVLDGLRALGVNGWDVVLACLDGMASGAPRLEVVR